MKLVERIKSKFDNEYFISLYENNLYVLNYKRIIKFTEDELIVSFDNKMVKVSGNDLKIFRKNEREVEISGIIKNVELRNE